MVRERIIPGGPNILDVAMQQGIAFGRSAAGAQVKRALDLGGIVLGVALLGRAAVGGVVGQALGGILAHQRMQTVARHAATGCGLQQRLVDQGHECGQRGAGDRRCRIAFTALGKHREPRQGAALVRVEQIPRMIERGPDGSVARRQIACGYGQQVEVAVDLGSDFGWRQGAHPAGRKLDRQRHAIQLPADPRHRRAVLTGQRKRCHVALCPLDKQAHGVGFIDTGAVVGFGHRQPAQLHHPFVVQPQPFARCHQQPQLGRAIQQVQQQGSELFAILLRQQVLGVVEHQQHCAPIQRFDHLICHWPRTMQGNAKRVGNCQRHVFGLADRGQANKRHAIAVGRVVGGKGRAHLQGQAGLADPARAKQRHQAVAVCAEVRHQGVVFACPPDQLGRRRWGPNAPGAIGAQFGEVVLDLSALTRLGIHSHS